MPLVVPALRLFVLFLNVYETFKTLKPPPPSTKRAGQPSIRALTQRKRDLKGCLAIWVVWCCYAAFERTLDRIVSIFIPFYSEIKSVLLLFLILTRAKGAEPLFLHVIRPFVKPYSTAVDPILEITRDIGDFLFALLQVPLDYVLSWCWAPSWHTGELEGVLSESSSSTHISSNDSGSSTRASSNSSIPTLTKPYGAVQGSSRVQNKRPGSIRSVSDNRRRSDSRQSTIDAAPAMLSARERHSKAASTTSLPRYSAELSSQDPPRYSQTLPRNSRHQIWHPPTSAYDQDPLASSQELGPMSASTPDLGYAPLRTAPEYHSPEWRTYPAFPSAYPPTPLPGSTSLPSPIARTQSDGNHRRISDVSYPPIPEDAAIETHFQQSLEQQRESNPSSDCSSSDDNGNQSGVQDDQGHVELAHEPVDYASDDASENGSHAGLSENSFMEEDDFNATLRTPYRSFPSSEAVASTACSSVESLTSALTTADNASSLRTRTSSESSSSFHSSDSSSAIGQKRSYAGTGPKTRSAAQPSHSRSATLRGRPAAAPVRQDSLQSSASDTPDEEDSEDSEDSGAGTKRRKVLEPAKRATHLRPTTRAAGTARKAAISARGVPSARARTVATTSHAKTASMARPPSNSSTIRGRGGGPASRPPQRGDSQGTIKRSNTMSSQSGTLRGKAK